MYGPSFFQQFITGLKYVLAVDGDDSVALRTLESRMTFATSLRREYGLDETYWNTVHCVRDTDPLAYTSPLHDNGGTATAADLATLWREHLHQGLYVPTTGTRGNPTRQRALHAFASAPRLVTQVRLVITPNDPAWETTAYVNNLAADLRILQPLWDIPTDLPDTDAARLHLVAQVTTDDMPDAHETLFDIMRATGMSRARSYTTLDDPRLTTFETIAPFDERSPDKRADSGLHDIPEDPLRTRFGIHTSGALFSVTSRTITNATSVDATKFLGCNWDNLHRAATRAGWAA